MSGQNNLNETLEKFRSAIALSEVYEFSLTPLDHLEIPLYCIGLWTEEAIYYDGFGYGASDTLARVSAWGEILENYYAGRAVRNMPRIVASYAELIAQNRNPIDPAALCLDAGCDYSSEQERYWVEVNNLSGKNNGKTVVPLESVAIHPAHAREISPEKLLFRPVTNGLGAGATLAQAIVHGALEIVQRDGNSVTYRALDVGCRIKLDTIKSDETRGLLRHLDECGLEIIPKLAGVVGDIPVIYVVGYDRDLRRAEFPMQLSACGEAAHPDREVALAKALREFVSSRARKHFMHGTLDKMARVAPAEYVDKQLSGNADWEESRALRTVLEWATATHEQIFRRIEKPILETRTTIKFSDVPTADFARNDSEAILTFLQKQFHRLGTEILYANLNFDGPTNVFVVHTIVPQMEVETMSYGRIGRRNFERLLERQKTDERIGKLVGYGADSRPETALPIHLTEKDRLKFPNAWLDTAAVARQVGDFYALYREPESFAVGRILRNLVLCNLISCK